MYKCEYPKVGVNAYCLNPSSTIVQLVTLMGFMVFQASRILFRLLRWMAPSWGWPAGFVFSIWYVGLRFGLMVHVEIDLLCSMYSSAQL